MSARGLFVTGTDTELGKTAASTALLHALRRRGLSAVGMKPVASGSEDLGQGLRNEYALALQAASWPVPDYADGAQGYVAPRTPFEEALVQIWADVLGVPQVGTHDDFFDLGGHSLLATQLISRVRDALQIELPLKLIHCEAID